MVNIHGIFSVKMKNPIHIRKGEQNFPSQGDAMKCAGSWEVRFAEG
jgi:hypothetical protein